MSSLDFSERVYFEEIFDMSSGYVLNLTDATYAEFSRVIM